MLRRGRTATSLSVPGHQSAIPCVYSTMDVLRSQGIHGYDLGKFFSSLEQITVGGRCPSRASAPVLSYNTCRHCLEDYIFHKDFRAFLADVKVCYCSTMQRP